jgi:transcriptional regulator with XRE-family HTH domain
LKRRVLIGFFRFDRDRFFTIMNSIDANKTRSDNELGHLLRRWRAKRGKSQLDLSLDTGISQRHISFVESARSVPSRQTLMDIAESLDVPLRDRNTLLLAAGYAPIFSEGAWNAAEMQSITHALTRMLRQHEPFPALVMDRYWNVLLTNDSALQFFNRFIDMAARRASGRPRNTLHLMFDPQGLRPFIANWNDVAKSLIQRVYRESVGRVVDEKTKELLGQLLAYPEVKMDWKIPKPPSALPVIPMSFVKGDRILNLFSLVTTVGTPQTIAAQELRVECMFPADEATEANYISLMNPTPSP